MKKALIKQKMIAQRGMSLVELMVALAIGTFLIAGVVQVFISNKSSERLETSLARLQENGRFALDLLTDDVYRAQYIGCNTRDSVITNMVTPAAGFQGVRGYEKGASSWVPATLPTNLDAVKANVRAGTDVLRLQTGRSLAVTFTSNINAASSSVDINENPGCILKQGDRVMVSSCLTVHMFAITNDINTCTAGAAVSLEFDSSLNTTTTVNAPYNPASELMLYEESYWYVADTGRDNNGMDVYALYRKVGASAAEEMIEGVEALEVRFGQRVPGTDNVRYVSPGDATLNSSLATLDALQMVRVALLMQSFELVRDTSDRRTYNLLGTDIDDSTTTLQHGGGRVLRQIFTTTVALRNAKDV